MPEKLKWSFAVQVAGGPTIAHSGEMEVDAYVKLAVSIPPGREQPVEIFPGDGVSAQVFVISPTKPSESLTCTVGEGTEPVKLDGPHILIGAGAVGLFAAEIGTVTFLNDTAEEANVSILVGRDATPPPPP